MKDVLLVDDDRDYLLLLGCLLKNEGLSVRCVASGEEALACLENQAFHLMITDLHMPGLDGLELSRQAIAMALDMAIIMNTGSISSEIPRLAKAAGNARILAKTSPPGEMLDAVKEATGRLDVPLRSELFLSS